MLYKTLNAKHTDHDAKTWRRYDALYRGGKAFREMVGEFLPKNPEEPGELYRVRKQEACYRCYVGPVVDYFVARLFASPFVPRAKDDAGETVEPDKFYSRLKEDADGIGADLAAIMASRFREALIKRTAWWCVHLPGNEGRVPRSAAEWQERGLGEARVRELEAEDVFDWEADDAGELLWVIVHRKDARRLEPTSTRQQIRETWWVYDRANLETFEIEYDKAKPPVGETDIESRGRAPHGFGRVPILRLCLPEGLWLVNRVHDGQVEHFRLSSAMGWSIRRTCYAMPVFNVEDKDNPPVMGSGYYVMIGLEEKLGYAAPPAGPFDVIASAVDKHKDEIYRVAQQMALGVDNNAAAVGRSADSKAQDADATDVCCKAYGKFVREAVEKTYNLIAEGRGDKLRWSVEGLDRFKTGDAAAAVGNASTASMLSVPSETFQKELFMGVVEALLPELDQVKKDAIRAEIEQGVDAESDMKALLKQAEDDAKLEQAKLAARGELAAPTPGGAAP